MSADLSYEEFLAAKAQLAEPTGFDPDVIPKHLFGFQADLLSWATRQGRAALFADCGLGKTPVQLAWADQVHRHTGKPVLVVTPLAVSFQTETEARKFDVDAAVSRDGTIPASITVTNYERLEHFDPHQFGGVVCDESSAIKAFDGKRRALVTEFLRTRPYRLLCTATAAPNDYVELGTSSEALGHLGHTDMLSRFFTQSPQRFQLERQTWRLRGHAESAFWRWVASWARAVRRPSDIGHPDDGFALPPLVENAHFVDVRTPAEGALFDVPAQGLHEERAEARRSIRERCEKAAELLDGSEPGVGWCQLNDESRLLASLVDGAVEVTGSDSVDDKEAKLAAFSRGDIRVLVTKPSIGAWGLNWQHCSRMTFFPSHSYEQYYQAVRRSWRFGQTRPVHVDVVTTEGGRGVLANLQRKAAQADRMFDQLTAHMRDALQVRRDDHFDQLVEVPTWAA